MKGCLKTRGLILGDFLFVVALIPRFDLL